MGHVVVRDVAYAHPGGETLFDGVSFRLPPGAHVGLIGANGVGKSTLLRVLAGELALDHGSVDIGGPVAAMPQDIGDARDDRSVRRLLLTAAPTTLRAIAARIDAAERALAAGEDPETHGTALGSAWSAWGDHGGYALEAAWDRACRRVLREGLDVIGARPVGSLSGGERKRLVLDALLESDAAVLLLDEPDNFLDVPAKRWLERAIAASPKTIVTISHDRRLLAEAVTTIVTLEGHGCWVHGGSYASYPEARAQRQAALGDRRQQWERERERLFHVYKTLKQRAASSSGLAGRADAAETRWRRFVDAGPPPAPVTDRTIGIRLRGGDSARRVLAFDRLAIGELVRPFSEEIRHGERVGLVGPNGTGKTHLMRLLAGEPVAHSGDWTLGNRVSVGHFTQLNDRPDHAGRTLLEIVGELTADHEAAMRSLARYGLVAAASRSPETLSGGQRARLEILGLELAGHNLLLLDEPTDNLDIDSCEALEGALESFVGTIVAVSHDRAFLRRLDRCLLLDRQGAVWALPDVETTLTVLAEPDALGAPAGAAAKRLTA